MYLADLNSSNRVIIVVNTGRFKRVKNRKRTGVIGTLLDIVFDMADLQRR